MSPGSIRRIFLTLATALMLAGPALASTTASEPDDMALGNPKAPVTVVEYASASCPHCARFNNDVFPEFKKKYVDSGKVYYVFREYLTQPVEVAAAGFLLARCAGPAKYFQVMDDFFHGQAHVYETGDMKSLLLSAGGHAGLSEDQVKACFDDKAAADALNARVERHVKDGVESTPTFIVNGSKLPELTHEVTLADLDAAIQPLLKGRRR
jgi:protein-disulfide isomerase